MSSQTALAMLTGGLGVRRNMAIALLTDLVGGSEPGEDPPPELGGFGDRFGDFFGGEIAVAPELPARRVPDDGGERIEVVLRGAPDGAYLVRMGGVTAYSGVPGQGAVVHPSGPPHRATVGGEPDPFARRLLRAVVPAGLPLGVHDVEISGPRGAAWSVPNALLVVRRPRRSRDYAIRALFPPGSYTGARGEVDPGQGEVLDP